MSNSKSSKRWDERRKTAVEALKKQIEKYTKSKNEDKLKKASASLANTIANMGKGLSGMGAKPAVKPESILN